MGGTSRAYAVDMELCLSTNKQPPLALAPTQAEQGAIQLHNLQVTHAERTVQQCSISMNAPFLIKLLLPVNLRKSECLGP